MHLSNPFNLRSHPQDPAAEGDMPSRVCHALQEFPYPKPSTTRSKPSGTLPFESLQFPSHDQRRSFESPLRLSVYSSATPNTSN